MTKEEIQLLSELIDKKLDPINDRLNKMDERFDKIDERLDKIEDHIAEIKEDTQITRSAANELIKWVELNSTSSNPFPVDKAI